MNQQNSTTQGKKIRLPLTFSSRLLFAFLLSSFLFSLTFLPFGPLKNMIPSAAAHAYLLQSSPEANAVLQAPPQQVLLWFSEDLNPSTSRAVVVDTTNRQVDSGDAQVSSTNSRQIQLGLPLLPAGTYVVVWRSQSAEDGHIAGGSFLFRIARPDGTIPPIPAVLPTGHFPGAAGSGVGGGTTLDGPTLLQTLMNWLAELLLVFWIGSLLWETWILPPREQTDPAVKAAAGAAQQRFLHWEPLILFGLLLADLGVVLSLAAQLAGNWSGMFSLPLLHAVLFGSHFGLLWWIRQGLLLAVLVFLLLQRTHLPASSERNSEATHHQLTEKHASRQWQTALSEVVRQFPHVPSRLRSGWLASSWQRRCELGLALLLLSIFVLSGHAAAVPASLLWYTMSSDFFHLLCSAIWVGGLLYIALFLLPSQRQQPLLKRAQVISQGIPAFSVLAILSVAILAITGTFNTTFHLTALNQFWTTLYGEILLVKIGLFLLMISMSGYHAFFLRPELTSILPELTSILPEEQVQILSRQKREEEREEGSQQTTITQRDERSTFAEEHHMHMLTNNIMTWLRYEAGISVLILLCVALLATFAGTLQPPPPIAARSTSAPQGFLQTQTVNGYSVTLQVTPDRFGPNTFTIHVTTQQGQPVKGAAVLVITEMLDMDMGTDAFQVQPLSGSEGNAFGGQDVLTMEGHWKVVIKMLPPNSQKFLLFTFLFMAQ